MKASQYVARQPDANGFIDYSEVEHRTWHTLIERQLKVIEQRACQEYLDGLDKLALPSERIPQLADICLLYTSPSPRDLSTSRMPSSA